MSKIDDLVAAMTLEEKIGQLVMVSLGADTIVTGPGAAHEPSVDEVRRGRVGAILNLVGRDRIAALQKIAVEESRLGIPLLVGLDVVHGYWTDGPVPLGETAAFRPDLWAATARLAAEEATDDGIHLTFAPMLDLARDPRWGRIVEGPGEDAHVGTVFAAAKVKGFQGRDLADPTSLAATAKHFAAYGAVTAGRDYASVDISERTLHEVYLPAFRAAVAAGCAAIMPAFVDLAGRPMSADGRLLTDLVRRRWGFRGIHVSDYDAVGELVAHGVAADMAEAAALALTAGMDLDMMSPAYPQHLQEALDRGLVAMADLDAAVARVLDLKMRLGLFDAPFARGGPQRPALRPPEVRRRLVRDAAAASLVLLTNRDEVLPLAAEGGRIALIGPFGADGGQMLGPWFGLADREPTVSLADGLAAAFPNREIVVETGVERQGDNAAGITRAVAAAASAEVVLLAVGEPAELSGEAASRTVPGLTGRQADLTRAVLATGRPVVVLLACGRPLIETWLFEAAAATLVLWYPGSEAGHAVADVLCGARSPSGRLPVSWPRVVGQIPVYYGERPSGRPFAETEHFTTRWVDSPNEPLFPFGHGLSYTAFSHGVPKLASATVPAGLPVTVTVDVANLGARTGATTVFLFLRDLVASTSRPLLELKRFETFELAAGTTRLVAFTLEPDDFALLGPDLEPVIEPGAFEIFVGFSADRRHLRSVTVTLTDPAAAVAAATTVPEPA